MSIITDSEEIRNSIEEIVQNGLDMVIITDYQGKIVYVNRRFESVTGYSSQEVIGKNPRILNSGRQTVVFYKNLWDTIKNGENWRGSFCNKKKNGDLFWTDSIIVPVIDSAGQITNFTSAHYDVTESHRLRERLKATVDTAVSAIITVNSEGIIEDFNAAAQEIFGYKKSEIYGQTVWELFPESSAAIQQENIERFLKTGSVKNIGHKIESRACRRDGSEFPVKIEMSAFETDTGYKFVEIIADISREVEYREKIEKLNEELKEKNSYLERLTIVDPLTGMANRRRFEEKFFEEWERCMRAGEKLSVIILDIDHFKDFNDFYGHPAGDRCLKEIGEILQKQIKRAVDVIARYGGEEFAAILPATDIEAAVKLAEKIRKTIYNEAIEHEKSSAADVITISAGVACMVPSVDVDHWEIVERADRALYSAKSFGRNCVKVSGP